MTQQLRHTTNSSFKSTRWLPVWVAIAGLFLYANTIGNGYALDDGVVIAANPYVQKGIQGIPGIFTTDMWHFQNSDLGYYRPLSLVTFAIENQFLHNNPHVSHLINVLLYALTGFVLCLVLMRIFNNRPASFSFIVALLFMAHPIHTEVVANIKGRDEILALLNILLALWFILKATADEEKLNWKLLLPSCFFFYLALLSKETALTGLFLIPAILYFVQPFSVKQVFQYSIPFLIVLLVFLFQKYSALGSVYGPDTNDIVSFPYTTTSAKFVAAFTHLAWYIKLVFIPYPLSYNYAYNQIPAVDWTSPPGITGIILAIVLVFLSIKNLNKKSPVALGVLLFVIGLIPAIGFVILKGGILAERFLYFPSLGFCMVITWLIFKALKLPFKAELDSTTTPGLKILPFAVIFLCYSFTTISRNMDWKNDLTLSGHDVLVSPNSCQVHLHYGKTLIDNGVAETDDAKKQSDFKLGSEQLREAISIYPHYARAYFKLAYAYQSLQQNNDSAIYYYTRSIDEAPGYALAYNNLGALYFKLGRLQMAEHYLQKALEINPGLASAISLMQKIHQTPNGNENPLAAKPAIAGANDTMATFKSYSNLGVKYAQQKNFTEAQKYLIKAIQLNPTSAEARVNLAVCYGMMQAYDQSARVLNDALKIDPNNKSALQNMAALYHMKGDKIKEQEFRDRLKKAGP